MRALVAVLALAATVSLSGCFWWGDGMSDDGFGDGDADTEFALVLLGIAVLVGIVLVVVNLSNQGGTQPPQPPFPPRFPPQPPQGGWQEVEAPANPPAGSIRTGSKAPAPKPRRRAP